MGTAVAELRQPIFDDEANERRLYATVDRAAVICR
jgi:hypothetical protein